MTEDLAATMAALREEVDASKRSSVDAARLGWVEWWAAFLLDRIRFGSDLQWLQATLAKIQLDVRHAQLAPDADDVDIDATVGLLRHWRETVRQEILHQPGREYTTIDNLHGLVQPGEPAGDGRHHVTCSGCGSTAVVDDLDLLAGLVVCQSMGRMEPPS